MANSDADNFSLMDMEHELCDISPCLECRDEDEQHAEEIDECNICGRTEYMCPGH